MPSATTDSLSFEPLHPTIGAEVKGMLWNSPEPESAIEAIRDAVHKYGVLVFRRANLDNEQHISFSRQFGDLVDQGQCPVVDDEER